MAKKAKTKPTPIETPEPMEPVAPAEPVAEESAIIEPTPAEVTQFGPPPAPLDPNIINVAFTVEELDTFANLLAISASTYQQLASYAAQQNDEASFGIHSARQKLSYMLATRLSNSSKIGEPTSRDLH
jgi:hypothetical protein